MRKSATKIITVLTFIMFCVFAYLYAGKIVQKVWKSSPPEITQSNVAPHGTCNACHENHNAPGGNLTLVNGNANLCMSCHNPAGTAASLPFSNANKARPGISGNSHSWDVNGVNALYESNLPFNNQMLLRTPSNFIICSTCHNQHSQDFPPFLRATNDGDAMCKDCHSARNVGTYVTDTATHKGSHPVGILYNGSDTRFLASPLAPLQLVSNKVECSSCHTVHYAATNDGNLLKAPNNDNLCANCHTYGNHHGMTCSSCHQTHNPDKTNIFLVKDSILTPNSGLKPVVLATRTGLNSFADGNANYNGVCEVCHTSTLYHRNNSSGDHTHNPGANCIDCHEHKNAFSAGSCTTCHSLPQDNHDGVPVGGRRAIMGEFPLSNAHAHYGVTLNGASCYVCHDMSAHKSGHVRLIDADNGSIYSFVNPQDLSSDPDISTFCMSCHDANGAMRFSNPFNPFGNGNKPPDTKSRFQGSLQWNEWFDDNCSTGSGTLRAVNSHHDISNADQAFSGAKIECLSCHGSHNPSKNAPMADPNNTISVWTGTYNGFCLTCHSGTPNRNNPFFPAGVTGPTIKMRGLESCNYDTIPWLVSYTWSNSAHGGSSKRGWPGYSGAPGYNMSCKDCHDPHGSYSADNTPGNPYMIRDTVDGTGFVDDGIRQGSLWTGPPWNTFGIKRAVKVSVTGVSVSWGSPGGLCNVCHAGWIDAYSWHSTCSACQNCHIHGNQWENKDWVNHTNAQPCNPSGEKSESQMMNELRNGRENRRK